jgi:CDP-diacylglycerol---serine O-phosphatidyltransferase
MLKSRRKPRVLPIAKLIPNAMTLAALALGMTSIRLGLEARYETAFLCILGASFLDAIDGRIARLLRAESPIGAQLDSLADFMNFGLAPPILLYMWGIQDTSRVGWMALVIFAACCALRLARFNADIENPDNPAWTREFFTGMPSPAAGLLALAPFCLQFASIFDLRQYPMVLIVLTLFWAMMMVSRVPTFSGKHIGGVIRRDYVPYVMIAVAFFAAGIFTFPWAGLLFLAFSYIGSLPFSWLRYRRLSKRSAAVARNQDVENTDL